MFTEAERRMRADLLARIATYRVYRDEAATAVARLADKGAERTVSEDIQLTIERERLAANREVLMVLWEVYVKHAKPTRAIFI